MNFLSHFYLDRNTTDSLYVAGICSPDLVSIFNRKVKLKKKSLGTSTSPPTHFVYFPSFSHESFYMGVQRHYSVDAIFHTCPFFEIETAHICHFLRTHFDKGEVKRDFFVAHVLLELMIDKVLVGEDPTLVDDFYVHLQRVGAENLHHLAQHFTDIRLDAYPDFLQRFLQNKYLSHYDSFDYISFVLKRIINRIGVSEIAFIDTQIFKAYLLEYEAALAPKIQKLFVFLHQELNTNTERA